MGTNFELDGRYSPAAASGAEKAGGGVGLGEGVIPGAVGWGDDEAVELSAEGLGAGLEVAGEGGEI